MAEKQRDEDDSDSDEEQKEKKEQKDSDVELPIQVSEPDSESSRFEEAIASLSNRDQIFLNELSKVYFNLSEYARRRGISRQAVAKRLSRIKEKLKKFIG